MQPTRVVIAALVITIGATAAPPIAHAGKAPAILSSLPDDTTMLGGVDLKKLDAAPIAADAVSMMKSRAATELAKVKALGVDLEKDVVRVYVALAGAGLTEADQARLKIVIAEGKIKIDTKAITDPAKTHHGVTYWSTTDVDFAVINKRLYLVSDGHMPDLIDVIKGKVKNAVKSPNASKLRAAISATTISHEGWVVGVVSDADRKVMGTQGTDMAWFSASAALRTDAIDFAVRLGMTSAATAKAMSDTVTAQIGVVQQSVGSVGLADLGKSLTVGATGSVVALGGTVTKQEMSVIGGLINMMASSAGSSATSSAAKPPPSPAPARAPSTGSSPAVTRP